MIVLLVKGCTGLGNLLSRRTTKWQDADPMEPGTREYLTVEQGEVELSVGGELFLLAAGDVVMFRGDQRHGYRNPRGRVAIAYSVIAFAPSGG
jgi:mannose-6-phosphate isomerase-like protein (cupin superfamily)